MLHFCVSRLYSAYNVRCQKSHETWTRMSLAENNKIERKKVMNLISNGMPQSNDHRMRIRLKLLLIRDSWERKMCAHTTSPHMAWAAHWLIVYVTHSTHSHTEDPMHCLSPFAMHAIGTNARGVQRACTTHAPIRDDDERDARRGFDISCVYIEANEHTSSMNAATASSSSYRSFSPSSFASSFFNEFIRVCFVLNISCPTVGTKGRCKKDFRPTDLLCVFSLSTFIFLRLFFIPFAFFIFCFFASILYIQFLAFLYALCAVICSSIFFDVAF